MGDLGQKIGSGENDGVGRLDPKHQACDQSRNDAVTSADLAPGPYLRGQRNRSQRHERDVREVKIGIIERDILRGAVANKEMRSLLLVLPVFWLAVFWAMEHWRVRPGYLFLTAVAYVLCAYSQLFFNVFGSKDVSTEGYQLKDDWLSRLPQKYIDVTNGEALTESVLTTKYNLSLKGRRTPTYSRIFSPAMGPIAEARS
jgi:hypothetical protein